MVVADRPSRRQPVRGGVRVGDGEHRADLGVVHVVFDVVDVAVALGVIVGRARHPSAGRASDGQHHRLRPTGEPRHLRRRQVVVGQVVAVPPTVDAPVAQIDQEWRPEPPARWASRESRRQRVAREIAIADALYTESGAGDPAALNHGLDHLCRGVVFPLGDERDEHGRARAVLVRDHLVYVGVRVVERMRRNPPYRHVRAPVDLIRIPFHDVAVVPMVAVVEAIPIGVPGAEPRSRVGGGTLAVGGMPEVEVGVEQVGRGIPIGIGVPVEAGDLGRPPVPHRKVPAVAEQQHVSHRPLVPGGVVDRKLQLLRVVTAGDVRDQIRQRVGIRRHAGGALVTHQPLCRIGELGRTHDEQARRRHLTSKRGRIPRDIAGSPESQ